LGGSECIILVDDEEMILRMQKEMLTGLGYKVEIFSCPDDALQHFIAHLDSCDLIITDMTMPKMTGDVLAGKMQQLKPGLPVILSTGFSEIINREKALAQGISEFLVKPVQLSELASTVRRLLDLNRTAPTGITEDFTRPPG
jgi:DNA-binding NtrC family response regulator